MGDCCCVDYEPASRYGQPDEPDPEKKFAMIRPHSSTIPMRLLDSLERAVKQYGKVATKWPSEFSDRVRRDDE